MRVGSVQLKITEPKYISWLHADHFTASVHSPLDNTEANSHHHHYRCYSITTGNCEVLNSQEHCD